MLGRNNSMRVEKITLSRSQVAFAQGKWINQTLRCAQGERSLSTVRPESSEGFDCCADAIFFSRFQPLISRD